MQKCFALGKFEYLWRYSAKAIVRESGFFSCASSSTIFKMYWGNFFLMRKHPTMSFHLCPVSSKCLVFQSCFVAYWFKRCGGWVDFTSYENCVSLSASISSSLICPDKGEYRPAAMRNSVRALGMVGKSNVSFVNISRFTNLEFIFWLRTEDQLVEYEKKAGEWAQLKILQLKSSRVVLNSGFYRQSHPQCSLPWGNLARLL